MAKEIWKHIEGYSLYQISNTGKIKTCRSRKSRHITNDWYELKLRDNHKTNYVYVGLYEKGSTRKWFRVHRLVYHHFKGCIPDTLIVDHIDNNKKNNHISNLQLLTRSENIKKHYKQTKENI